MENNSENSRKKVLNDVSQTLRDFNFESFDLRTDKPILMAKLKEINIKLGGLLKGYK